MPPEPVKVVTVKAQEVPITQTWVGTLTGDVNAEIRAQVTGYLQEQVYQNGMYVKAGDILFQIDPRPFQASLDQANGNLAEAQATLTKDQLNAQRATELYKKQVISQQEYDDQTQTYQSSKAAVEAAQAAVEQAALNLGFTKITSPINGLSSIATAQVGDLVGSSSGVLATVVSVDPIKVEFSVAEQQYIDYVKQFFTNPKDSPIGKPRTPESGMAKLILTLAGGTVYPHDGQLSAVNNTVTQNTGALSLEGLFPNPGHLLRPGQFGLVTAVTDTAKDGILVPQRAVIDLQGTSQIATIEAGNKVNIVNVTLGPTIGSDVLITSGLKAGDVVVVEGIQKIRQGATVNPSPYTLTEQEANPEPGIMPAEAVSPSPTPARAD